MKTSPLFGLIRSGSIDWLFTTICCFVLLSSPLLADNHNTPSVGVEAARAESATVSPAPAEEKPDSGSAIENSMANLDTIQQMLQKMSEEVESSKEKSSLNQSSMQSFRDGLALIEEKLKEAYSGLDESRGSIGVNSENIEKVHKELLESTREIRANTADLDVQKSLIEDNSIRLYEMLIRISNMRERTEELSQALIRAQNIEDNPDVKPLIASDLNQFWRFITTVLAFLAPAAFLSANALQNNRAAIPSKYNDNVFLICIGAFLGYFVIGFGLMYGTTSGGFFGVDSYLLSSIPPEVMHPDVEKNADKAQGVMPHTGFLLYQSSSIMLAAIIIAIPVGRYLSNLGCIFLAFAIGAAVLPVFGHWSWASYLVATNKGWLEGAGFIDQSGAVVVHTVAAWFAFTLTLKLNRSSTQPDEQTAGRSLYAGPAVFILWISWMGLTLGNLAPTDNRVPLVLMNVSLAAAASAVISFMHYAFFHNDESRITQMLYSGFVSGLVAIAACVQLVTPLEAVAIGATAGLLQNIAFSILRRFFFRQDWQFTTAQLIAVHGFAGIWGALCVALFGTENTFGAPNLIQLFTQVQGITVAIAYSIAMAYAMLFLLAFIGKKRQKQAT